MTTARVTHATPAPLYAASADRKWESDADLTTGAQEEGCQDIGAQLVDGDVGSKLNVSVIINLCLLLQTKLNKSRIEREYFAKIPK